MYPPVTIRILAVALCGWLVAGEASALGLGRAHGAALIGRPLAVTIPVSIEPGELENLCPSADLFYGDTRVSAPSVRWEASGPAQGVLRLEASTPVDEPTVTVYLKVGCRQASTRRYVFLAEPPGEYTARAGGKITVLRDSNNDGKADQRFTFLPASAGYVYPHGLAFQGGYLYVGDVRGIWR